MNKKNLKNTKKMDIPIQKSSLNDLDGRDWMGFLSEISTFVNPKRIYTDDLRRLAWGTDAGFYRLIPEIVIRSINETEVARLLQTTDKYELPVTFRAAGTSLSGQAISDSIMIVAGQHWEKYKISDDYSQITMQPGIVGERVNQILKPYGVKFSPDPASVKYAMVGGIVINNASGMNCGTHANSDRMLISARMVFPDGTILNTDDTESKKEFAEKKPEFIQEIINIRNYILNNKELHERIRHKYSIKNVTGLNISPFIHFDDPFDIIAHLLVGSEGTLAFLSEVTMKTEHDYPHRASAMLYFKSILDASRAVVEFSKLVDENGKDIVKAAEFLDKKSLSSVNDTTGKNLTAILTEVKGDSKEEIFNHIEIIKNALSDFDLVTPIEFTDNVEEYSRYWAIRSGIFPTVGGTRPLGTSCLIEDVAFHRDDIPNAVTDLQNLLEKHGYHDACIYGHSLQGNFHFILNQSFDTEKEVQRYEKMMDEVVHLVVKKYDGSLKAEHGTGRNMAPFVEYEWGKEAFEIMKRVKKLFDPKNLLNPGVIFNDDPKCHLKNLKPMPMIELKNGKTGHTADKCIECGFCEINCLSSGFTLSARQRIVAQREITRLRKSGENPQRLANLERDYVYLGEQTCAVDSLCSTSCPMGIDTGDLTHDIRNANVPSGSLTYKIGNFAANHFAGIKSGLRPLLGIANTAHSILGTKAMSTIVRGLHKTGLPLWTASLPKPYKLNKNKIPQITSEKKVVYFPSCINQTMGVSKNAPDQAPLVDKMISLLHKAGYEIIFPEKMERMCCGTIWESKGMYDTADRKTAELEHSLWEASKHGKYPVLCDQSPCTKRMKHKMKQLKIYEPAEFIYTFLQDNLQFNPTDKPITLHITCSMIMMGLTKEITELAKLCSTHVLIPTEVGCCGFAGDRGFTYPELNEFALRKLPNQIKDAGIQVGYSNSRTCEIGLETNAEIPYVSIVYLVDEVTAPLAP